jgi:Holliday junction resolvase RusA-like endonuclease
MRRSYSFRVDEPPPLKGTGMSIWAPGTPELPSQFDRVKALRLAAWEARRAVGGNILKADICLWVRVYAPKNSADLDNMVGGILDALAARRMGPGEVDSRWVSVLDAIRPDRAVLIRDDREVLNIVAKKIIIAEHNRTYYEIMIDGKEE